MSEEKMSDATETEETVNAAADVEVTTEGPTAEAAGTSEDSSEDLAQLLDDARARADEHWDQVLRMQAELENTRRRAAADVEKAHKYALDKFAADLLPVVDSLEMGLAAAEASDDAVAEKLREGTELTLKMLSGVLEKFGIKQLNPVGEPFNPELHQAMTMQPSEEYAPNTVTAVMQKGYVLNERLIRPAMVMVSK
ncbi:MAG: nucleotide exchange factor GrpE [Chromatiales bacterium]|nr:nucleotide exchange factor GrpE [Chromatiales bacterium]